IFFLFVFFFFFFFFFFFCFFFFCFFFFFFQAEDGIRDRDVTGVQTCALPISSPAGLNRPSTSAPGSLIPGRSIASSTRFPPSRSEERRVGKECRSRWSRY